MDLLEMTVAMTKTHIATRTITAEALGRTLRALHDTLLELLRQEQGAHVEIVAPPPPRIGWRRSIKDDHVICLECGRRFRQLSTPHLKRHGMSAREYRQKYRIPQTQSLCARETAQRRRASMLSLRPWERVTRRGRRKGTKNAR